MGEQMYCSQQICIPPTFPYLLRQFAKAAIRTQPNDLLKWSTTYFRCLSLNIPPPVKPRLEYPIPRDHHGLTPGWLRALLHQMAGSQTVSFKVLWDRWIGACLQHQNLIQILCLGGFTDNMAIPWLRFIGLCAAHLTDNLTQTMILICEILTEEPEGGSAMISAEIFFDLYKFLARIDASIPQTLRNYYFLDKFLELFREKIAKDYGEKPAEEEEEEKGLSLASSESTIKSEKESKKEDEVSIVSCPSVASQDPDNYMKLLMKIRAEGEETDFAEDDIRSALKAEGDADAESGVVPSPKMSIASDKRDDMTEFTDSAPQAEGDDESLHRQSETPGKFSEALAEELRTSVFPGDRDDTTSRDTHASSVIEKSITDASHKDKSENNQYLLEDLERLRAVHQEIMGEDDDEIEKFKASILADAGLTQSQMVAPEHFKTKIREEPEVISSESIKSEVSVSSEPSDKEKPQVEEMEYEDVFVEPVPGIGPKVPEELIEAVCIFMSEVAKLQHGMVMPRNIRHFECPPLQFYED